MPSFLSRRVTTIGGSPCEIVYGALALRPDGAGVSTYIRELLAALAPQLHCKMAALVSTDAVDQLPRAIAAISHPPAAGARRALQGLRPCSRASVVHGLDVDLPVLSKARTISTFHDMAVFDVPRAFPQQRVIGERLLIRRAIARADIVLAVSAFTAERIRARFNRDVEVIAEAPASTMRVADEQEIMKIRQRYQLPPAFVLYVGTVEPRKNIHALAEACTRIGIPLVIAGKIGWNSSAPSTARVLGYVPQCDIPPLYGAATLSAYVSTYEGFGLPPLEALKCGCPVVATAVPATELVPDGIQIVKSPHPDHLEPVIRDIVDDVDRRREMAELGRGHVLKMSWRSIALRVIDLYHSLGLEVPLPTIL